MGEAQSPALPCGPIPCCISGCVQEGMSPCEWMEAGKHPHGSKLAGKHSAPHFLGELSAGQAPSGACAREGKGERVLQKDEDEWGQHWAQGEKVEMARECAGWRGTESGCRSG